MARVDATVRQKRIAKILIVDDSARMRRIIRETVKDLVEEIFEAQDGGAAIESYLLHKPDWVTMDLEMKPVDGLTAARAIKDRDPQARILIVTVHDAKAFCEAARQAGAVGYILKDDLVNIREVIAPGCTSRTDRPNPPNPERTN